MSENGLSVVQERTAGSKALATNGSSKKGKAADAALMPSWAAGLRTQRERNVEQKLRELEAERDKLQKQIDYLKSDFNGYQWVKALVCTQDEEYTDAVVSALKCFGFKVCPGPERKADLLAWDKKTILAVRAVALPGVTRKLDVVQCSSWVNDVVLAQLTPAAERDETLNEYVRRLESLGVPIEQSGEEEERVIPTRGTLIMNTFCNTPLPERPFDRFNIADFPDPHSILEAKLLAMTGLQLMCMVLAAGDDMAHITELRTRFAIRSGVLDDYTDWQSHVS